MYCLDTNIIIDFFRGKEEVVNKILNIESISINPLILCELYKGANLAREPQKELERIKQFYDETTLLEFDATSCRVFGELYGVMKRRGITTPIIDLMIAAICITHNATLITNNKKHYENIPGLNAVYV